MKILLIFTIFSTYILAAFDVNEFIQNYKNKEYKKACKMGAINFNKIKKDPNLITIYAFSCLYDDQIDRLSTPILFLKNSPIQRQNRAYFSLIIAQKAILINAIFDNKDYFGINIPNTDYILSRVSNLFFQKKYKKKGQKYEMEDDKGRYILYKGEKKGKDVMVIEEFTKDGHKIHYYR